MVIDISSLSFGDGAGGLYGLSKETREQTVLDYTRTTPGVYNLLNKDLELTANLPSIEAPTLVVWGEQDRTLLPKSFKKLVAALPNATGKSIKAGHIPHQSNPDWFNRSVLEFLATHCQ